MSKKWSKEDRYSFGKSEVMRELETIVLDTVRRADILMDKRAQQDIAKQTQELKALTESAEAASEAVKSLTDGACDGEADHEDHAADEVAEHALADEVIDDLRSLARSAIAEGNVKLAYRIERTIDEIMETDVSCE